MAQRVVDLLGRGVDRGAARQRDRQIRRADEERVDAVDGENVVDDRHRLARLDHREGQREIIGLPEIAVLVEAGGAEAAIAAPAALAERRILGIGRETTGILDRVDHRRDHAGRAGIEQLRDVLELADRDAGESGLAGGIDQRDRPDDLAERDRAVLHVERDRIEIFLRQDRGDARVRQAAPGGKQRLTLGEAVCERGEHGRLGGGHRAASSGCGRSSSAAR